MSVVERSTVHGYGIALRDEIWLQLTALGNVFPSPGVIVCLVTPC